jgi:alpha-ketoglutarate-dependent taurine dioxygenase
VNRDESFPDLPKLASVRRRPITAEGDGLVRRSTIRDEGRLPLVLEAAADGIDLAAWASPRRAELTRALMKHGAILFRGFSVGGIAGFESLVRATSEGEMLEYSYASTPRKVVERRVYTSTEYPADQAIPLHNEMSYSRRWPMKLWLYCIVPAATGGETPIADSRRVLARIRPAIRATFDRNKVQYLRNYGSRLDLPWQSVFHTEQRSVVEAFCRSAGIQFDWIGEDRLRTRQTCQATARHPVTGDDVWFNQAHLFHVSSLTPDARDLLVAEYGLEGIPRNCFYGDGSPIDESWLQEIRDAYDKEAIVFSWRAGDVLMLDNMLSAHGRAPFQGERNLVVAMAEAHALPESEQP